MKYLQIDCPANGDPFFNTNSAGGISTCIVAKNAANGKNTLPNCVAGAWGFFNKFCCKNLAAPRASYLQYPPNAGQLWINRALQEGLKISQTPAVGCVAVWGNVNNINTGHVAGVYKIGADGTIYTAESEWGGRVWVNRQYAPPYVYSAGKRFLGFILPPDSVTAEHTALQFGSRGAEVKILQNLLISGGYLRKGECDGDFGRITKGALCCYQLENGLKVTGICDAETWAKIDK